MGVNAPRLLIKFQALNACPAFLQFLEFCEFQSILLPAPKYFPLRSFAVIGLISLASGCWRELKERAYDAPKIESEFVKGREPQPRRSAPPMMGGSNIPMREKRILGAIIPDRSNVYFVKATDRIAKLNSVEPVFRTIVEQFAFDPQTGTPKFELPSGWSLNLLDNAGAGIGLAEMIAEIFVESANGRIRFTVSKYDLPRDPAKLDDYLLGQINRWRSQVELDPIGVAELKKDLPTISRIGAALPAYLFDADGSGSKGTIDAPVNPVVPSASTAAISASPKSQLKLVYDKPADWELQPPSLYREATFRLTKDSQQGEVTVSTARDSPVQNAAMWVGQVLPSSDVSVLESLANKTVEEAEPFLTNGRNGKLYAVKASNEPDARSILVASIPMGDTGMSMFVKLNCELRLMEQEKSTFLNFVNSLRWE